MPSGTPSLQEHLATIWNGRGASSPHERARTLGLFYALGSLVALGTVAVGAWPTTDRLRVVAVIYTVLFASAIEMASCTDSCRQRRFQPAIVSGVAQ